MGSLEHPMGLFASKEKGKIVVVGLDNAGKTSILRQMSEEHQGNVSEVTPTVGFSTEVFEHGECEFEAFDMSGQSRYRTLWEHYYQEAQGIIFVVDSTDQFKMPVLFFANKKDMAAAASQQDIFQALNLAAVSGRAIQIQPSNALNGDGISAGLEWLSKQILK